MIGLVNASLCLGKLEVQAFIQLHHHSCSTNLANSSPKGRFVKQIGHYHDHPVSIRWVLVLVEGGQTHLILSAIALTPSFHLVRFAASYSSNPVLFKFSSTCSSISALAFLDFAAHSLQASMPSLERYHHLS